MTNPSLTRVLTSDGTAHGAIAESGFTYDSTNKVVRVQGTEYMQSVNLSGLGVGTNLVQKITVTSGTSTVMDYYIVDTTNGSARSGQVMVVWDASGVQYTDLSTPDLNGPTTAFVFQAVISGSFMQIEGVVSAGTWDVKAATRVVF